MRIGDEHEVEVLDDDGRVHIRGESVDAVLRVRGERQPVGTTVKAWCLGVNAEGRVEFSVDEFGRFPISDGMRRRYVAALANAVSVIDAGSDPLDDALADLKGMANRVLRRDQRDWASVARAFGLPSAAALREIAHWSAAIRSGEREPGGLQPEARRAIDCALEALTAGNPGAARRDLRGRAPRSRPGVTSRRAPRTWSLAEAQQAKLDRANREHERVRSALAAALEAVGVHAESNDLIDLFCHADDGVRLFEVKSITNENWREQVRKGVAQLHEYRYLHHLPEARLFLVLSEEPPEAWVVDMLSTEFDIGAIWMVEGLFAGPASRDGIAALRASAGDD